MAEFIAAGRTVPAENGWKWIVAGWNLFTRAPGIWIAIMVIFTVISIALAFIPVLGSIASMVLTTDTLVVEKKEEEPESAGHSHGGHGHSH